jgi:quercetin dioxygenase-like cupin family protein
MSRMRRHPALVPLSHDHHHALVQARRLREQGMTAAPAFLRFFAAETLRHFRDEEELVFPLLEDEPDELRQVLLEHQRIRALARRLRGGEDVTRELGELLDGHVRLEEQQLFDLIQRLVPDALLDELVLAPRDAPGPVADLAGGEGRGPLWGTASEDLNATLVAWPPGEGPPEHINAERDVLVVVVDGSGTLEIDGEPQSLRAPAAIVLEKGRSRRLVAGPAGIRYLTAHLRRAGLEIHGVETS